MQLPKLVTSSILAKLAKPEDSIVIRVVLRRIANLSPYKLHGKIRHYLMEFNAKVGAHILDVPLSVWNNGMLPGTYRDNMSIAHDIQSTRSAHLAPIVIFPVQVGTQGATLQPDQQADHQSEPENAYGKSFVAFKRILEALEAPPEAMEAFEVLLMDGVDDDARSKAIQSIAANIVPIDEDDQQPPQEPQTPEIDLLEAKRKANAEKVRRHREKKRAEKAAAKKQAKPKANKPKPKELIV